MNELYYVCNNSQIRHRIKKQNNMFLLETILLFGLAFCLGNSVEECNDEFDSDCFCYDEPRDNHEYSICVDPYQINWV